jgi:myo-inositol-1-phosphate synthase
MSKNKLGVWIVGALGSDATLAVVGVEAMRAGLADRIGLVTDLADFKKAGLADLDDFVFGGHEIREGDLVRSATEYARDNGVLTGELVRQLEPRLRAIGREIRMGTVTGCGDAIREMSASAARRDAVPLRQQVRDLQVDLLDFKKRNGLERVVVVNLASTEPALDPPPEFASLGAFERLVDANPRGVVPASVLYAYAALDAGCPHMNFTPSLGCSIPALDELSRRRGVPHMGKDGKTGETMMKTVLAPMFQARNLRILSWEGHNLLGNRDGEILHHPANNLAKVRDKDIVRKLLGDKAHSRVLVDYCPSLADWKTAWDFIHFEGYLGAKMRLHFIWEGNDTALAAPLVLDLVRLADLAHRRGESGTMPQTACFFKTPYLVEEIAFAPQMEMLRAYARKASETPAGGAAAKAPAPARAEPKTAVRRKPVKAR